MDALGFSLQFRVFLSCHLRLAPGHGSSSRAQSRHGSYIPTPKRQEASTLSEQISGQEDTTANRHGTNGTNNKHVILYPVIWYAAYFHRCGPPRADCQYLLRKVPARFLWILLETQLLFVKSQCRLHVSWSDIIRFYSKEVKYCHVEKSGYNRGIVHSVLIRNYVIHVCPSVSGIWVFTSNKLHVKHLSKHQRGLSPLFFFSEPTIRGSGIRSPFNQMLRRQKQDGRQLLVFLHLQLSLSPTNLEEIKD